jgi:hypothetical protein
MTSKAGWRWSSLQWGGNARGLCLIRNFDCVVCKVYLGWGRGLPLLGGASLALIVG